MEGSHIDEAKTTRIQQLETLLQDYKETNEKLWEEVDSLGGKPALGASVNDAEVISAELEKERQEKQALQESK